MIWSISENTITYNHLIELINQGKCSDFFSSFIADIVSDQDINLSSYKINKTTNDIKNIKDLKSRFFKSKSLITLQTSGTTGSPKTITHKISDLLKNTKESSKPKIWLFTYNKYHMGGIQVILQAFRNNSAIIDVYKKDRQYILNKILEHKVTNISATPTFYRLLLPLEKKCYSVNRVTVGGERTDKGTINIIKNMFPNAKINNIYATTETGAVLFSKDDRFKINNKVKIIDDILHIILEDNSLHCTGDLVEIKDHNCFVFSGRNKNIINIAGNNVNPCEIEDILKTHPSVKDTVVYVKKNKLLGNVLCCDLVLLNNLELNDIKKYLQENIQELHKIPRIIKIKDNIEVSKTNKVVR